jgi:hypothetical protein
MNWQMVIAILGFVNLGLIIFVAINNRLNHIKLTTNDLVHLTADVKTLISRQESISEKVNTLSTDLAFVRGNCALNSCKKTFKKSKKI